MSDHHDHLDEDPVVLGLNINLERLTHQRAALVAAISAAEGGIVVSPENLRFRDLLDGLLNLCDWISDEAQEQRGVDDETMKRWWAEGCIAVGLGDPREEEG